MVIYKVAPALQNTGEKKEETTPKTAALFIQKMAILMSSRLIGRWLIMMGYKVAPAVSPYPVPTQLWDQTLIQIFFAVGDAIIFVGFLFLPTGFNF